MESGKGAKAIQNRGYDTIRCDTVRTYVLREFIVSFHVRVGAVMAYIRQQRQK